jgi:hypothetical protein
VFDLSHFYQIRPGQDCSALLQQLQIPAQPLLKARIGTPIVSKDPSLFHEYIQDIIFLR